MISLGLEDHELRMSAIGVRADKRQYLACDGLSAYDPKQAFSDKTISLKALNWVRKGCSRVGHNAKRPHL